MCLTDRCGSVISDFQSIFIYKAGLIYPAFFAFYAARIEDFLT